MNLHYKNNRGTKVNEKSSQKYVKASFLKEQFFWFKVNRAIKECNKIKKYLLNKDFLSKHDSSLNLIISDGFSNEIGNSYFLYKGHNSDEGINGTRKYTIKNGEIVENNDVIKHDIIIIDLYEKSIYLHSYFKDIKHIMGYLLKEEISLGRNKTLIFTNEKVEINIKNINNFDTISVVDDFVNKYII